MTRDKIMLNSTYDKGKIYRYDGETFVEMETNSDSHKIPVTKEAFECLKTIRSNASKSIGARPDLLIAASAAILAAASLPDISEAVRAYGAHLYSRT